MDDQAVSHTDVLIIGAGPSGLTAAYWMARCGVKARIIDKRSRKVFVGHADGLQPRTLEIFDSMGFQHKVLAEGAGFASFCIWGSDGKGGLKCQSRTHSEHMKTSPYHAMLLGQGRIERFMLDTIRSCSDIEVERRTIAESLTYDEGQDIEGPGIYPITVKLRTLTEEEADFVPGNGGAETLDRKKLQPDDWDDLTPKVNKQPGELETVKAKYVLGCDGAHSWTRKQLNVPFEGSTTDFIWGVIDVVPITDYPDIRCAGIVTSENGTLLVVPRERQLTRFYVPLQDADKGPEANLDKSSVTLDMIKAKLQGLLSPFQFDFKICDWWRVYQIGRRLAPTWRKNRVYLAGDAVHSHSPKVGLGMNMSIQDAFNLGWKLALVVKGIAQPSILDTYEPERHKLATMLLEFDRTWFSNFQRPLQEDANTLDIKNKVEHMENIFKTFELFAQGFLTLYESSPLIHREGENPTKHLVPGERFLPAKIRSHADNLSSWTTRLLESDGRFRILLLAGDVRDKSQMQLVTNFSKYLASENSVIRRFTPKGQRLDSVIEIKSIHCVPSEEIALSDIPEVLRLFDDKTGWTYDKVWSDSKCFWDRYCDGTGYETWGVDPLRGALVVLRPDQYIGWIGELENVEGLMTYFNAVLREPSSDFATRIDV